MLLGMGCPFTSGGGGLAQGEAASLEGMNKGFKLGPTGDEVGEQRVTWEPQSVASHRCPGEDVNSTAERVEW